MLSSTIAHKHHGAACAGTSALCVAVLRDMAWFRSGLVQGAFVGGYQAPLREPSSCQMLARSGGVCVAGHEGCLLPQAYADNLAFCSRLLAKRVCRCASCAIRGGSKLEHLDPSRMYLPFCSHDVLGCTRRLEGSSSSREGRMFTALRHRCRRALCISRAGYAHVGMLRARTLCPLRCLLLKVLAHSWWCEP